MLVGDELAVGREPGQDVALPDRAVALDEVENGRLDDEEPAVHLSRTRRVLLEHLGHAVAVYGYGPEPRGGTDDGHRRQQARPAVQLDRRADVDVGDPVAIGEAEGLVELGIFAHTPDTA